MNSDEVIVLYEAIATITDQMVAAARASNWEQLAELESRCADHIATLKKGETLMPLPAIARERKAKIIQKILADDREIRSITEPWMTQLSALIKSASTERKLSQSYGANKPG